MKSQKLTIALVAILAMSLSFTACKKDSTTGISSSDSTKTQTDDEVMASNEMDNASNDGTASLETGGGTFASRPQLGLTPPANDTFPLPCDAALTFDTTGAQDDSVIILYNGNNCNLTRSRTGKIVVSFAKTLHWQTANAPITVTYENFNVVRASDHKSITINGSETITNITGDILRHLNSTDSIVHDITGTLHLTFDNNATATWTIHKHRDFTYNNGLVLTTTGSVSGTNRYGNQFTTVITTPVVIQNGCGYGFRVTAGVIAYTAPIGTITATFGLDASTHQPVAASTCPLVYAYELQYQSYTYFAPYF